MQTREVLRQLRPRLEAVFGSRLQKIVLHGSEVRGTAGPESDIDVLVVLSGPVRLWEDISQAIGAVYPLSLEWGRPISPKPVDVRDYEAGRFPLYLRAQQEGIVA